MCDCAPPQMEDQTSELQDGTLVDLCGATLLWRSADGLSRSPTRHDLERMVDQLNAGRPQCPVSRPPPPNTPPPD